MLNCLVPQDSFSWGDPPSLLSVEKRRDNAHDLFISVFLSFSHFGKVFLLLALRFPETRVYQAFQAIVILVISIFIFLKTISISSTRLEQFTSKLCQNEKKFSK